MARDNRVSYIYTINDISHCIKYSTIRCFADDTRISKAITCECDVKALQDDFDAVVEWSVNNNITLHEVTFEYIWILYVQQLKDFGLLVSQDLS